MSVYKPFITSDVIVSPFKVNKSFTFTGNELTGSNVQIDRFLGINTTASLWVSGSDNTGYITSQSSQLVYRSIKELYYSNYIGGDDGAQAATASFNNDGTITGPAYTPNYYNYLSNTLLANRYFPTGSDESICVISIPSNLFGEYLHPGTVILSTSSSLQGQITLQDDGLGNMISASLKVGDVIYEHGIIIITSGGITGSLDGYGQVNYGSAIYGGDDSIFVNDFYNKLITCSFESTVTIYETQYKCTIRENEFNFSNNPSLLSGSVAISNGSGSLFPQPGSGKLNDNVTGSYFSPYITTVGLYNNNKELLAVAKLAQPLPVSPTTDTSILINFDT
jgi:hypothetical protein